MNNCRQSPAPKPQPPACNPPYPHKGPLDRQRERARPFRNLLLHILNLLNITPSNFGFEVLKAVRFLRQRLLYLLADTDAAIDVVGNTLEVRGAHATGRHCWGADPDPTGRERRFVPWDGVFVARDVDLFEHGFHAGAVEGVLPQVQEHHVAVGAVRDQFVA